jgi:hypothetical protein
MASLADRFNALVDRSDTHNLWRGATDQHGIPQIRVDGRLTTARRVAWELHRGTLAHDSRVYGCPADPRCVRVEHLTISQRTDSPRPLRVRRPRGEGSMREVRAGVWKLTITTESHRRISRTITADPIGAERELARLAAQYGQPPSTLDALVTLHLAHLTETGRSHGTLRRYEQLWRTWLSRSLGATRPDELRRSHIEAVLESMARAGQSQRSIHQAAVVLNITLAWAHEQHMTGANPVTGCQLPDGTALTATRHR